MQFAFIGAWYVSCFNRFRHEISAIEKIIRTPTYLHSIHLWTKFAIHLTKKTFNRRLIQKYYPELYILLIVLNTFLDSLSNGASNSFMFHQKYFPNWQKQERRFQSKTRLSHNCLSKITTLYDKLGSYVFFSLRHVLVENVVLRVKNAIVWFLRIPPCYHTWKMGTRVDFSWSKKKMRRSISK